jgi:hypothetical protein
MLRFRFDFRPEAPAQVEAREFPRRTSARIDARLGSRKEQRCNRRRFDPTRSPRHYGAPVEPASPCWRTHGVTIADPDDFRVVLVRRPWRAG